MYPAKWFLLLAFVIPQSGNVFGDVPPDLAEMVAEQKNNKVQVALGLRQQAIEARQRNNFAGAKALKQQESDVRAGRLLAIPEYGKSQTRVGTIKVDKVVEKNEAGYRVHTSIARLEEVTGVDAQTGAAVRRVGAGSQWVYYPETIDVRSDSAIQAGQVIVVRRTKSGFEEVSKQEIEEATRSLKEGK